MPRNPHSTFGRASRNELWFPILEVAEVSLGFK